MVKDRGDRDRCLGLMQRYIDVASKLPTVDDLDDPEALATARLIMAGENVGGSLGALFDDFDNASAFRLIVKNGHATDGTRRHHTTTGTREVSNGSR